MGRGSGTTQQGVEKPRATHIAGDGSGISSFGGDISDNETPSNLCLFSLDLKIKYAAGTDPRVVRGDTVILARVGTDDIGIFVGNRKLSSYGGRQKRRLLGCMTQGFVYSGQVQSIGANTLHAVVKGGVLGYEKLSAA